MKSRKFFASFGRWGAVLGRSFQASGLWAKLYWWFAYLGVMTVAGSFVYGFRYDAAAPASHYLFNIGIYAAFIGVHIAMTMPVFKKAVFGHPYSTTFERRIYVIVSVVTWLAVYAFHKPVPGLALDFPAWVQFMGVCGILLGVVAFFEFATFEMLDQLLGTSESGVSHSVGAETPLLTEGSYARVRHPMYRAFVGLSAASLLLHPHSGQLLFAVLVSASFVSFIPFEEYQLIKARGEEYRRYKRQTPYRLFRGIW